MIKPELKKTIMSILVGAAVVALADILQAVLDLLLHYRESVVPAVVGMIHYLKSGIGNRLV